MSGSAEPTTVELHLGDRLAALIDGELEDESRERVLAHLATCPECKAEADGQRRVKSVFAGAAPPPPSDGLMARLQGLPATGPGFDADFGAMGGPPASGSRPDFSFPLGHGRHAHGSRTARNGPPGEGPLGNLFGALDGSVFGSQRALRAHRGAEAERLMARGRRFAFVAAGAVSLAAVALGGALTAGQPGTGSTIATATSRTPAAGVERGDRRGEQVMFSRARAAQPTPTMHSGASPGPLAPGGGAEADRVPLAARQYSVGEGGSPLSFQQPRPPRLGTGASLSSPLLLAAYQAHFAGGQPPKVPRPARKPFALPSANGSPVGPSPSPVAALEMRAPGASQTPVTSTMASNPRP